MRILILICSLFFTLTIFGQQKMSDRDIDGLKGKVKSVTTSREKIESKNYYDNTLKKLRDEIATYDENGAPQQSIDYEYNSKSIYSFIDGDLTLKFSQVRDDSNVVRGEVVGKIEQKAAQAEDKRYDLKFKYKFDEKDRITETKTYNNKGIIVHKIEYKYNEKGILIEERRYSEGIELNEQFFYKYDVSGNLIEIKEELHRSTKNIISFTKYSNYKLDKQGNWIERTVTTLGEFQGKELKTVSKHSRKIEYFN